MSAFNDMAKQDLDIFFNLFADLHDINGKQLNVIVDNDRLIYRSKKEFDGISVGEILYYVKASDFGKMPEVGSSQIFDRRQMYVFDAREDAGVYEIILHQNRS